MTIEAWPKAGDPAALDQKAQGLIDMVQLNLPVPPALIIRGDALTYSHLSVVRAAAVAEILRFLRALEGPRRTVSLRCAAKGRQGGARTLPESVLDLGLSEASVGGQASEVVCTAHAAAFFAFFEKDLPGGFARLPIGAQLDALLKPLLEHLISSPLLAQVTSRTIVVQQMVYGDWDARSVTGICYTRHPRTGEAQEYGHFIVGRRGMALGGVDDQMQRDLSELAKINPPAHSMLLTAFKRLEGHYGAVRQLEFTAEGEVLYLLQNTAGNSTFRLRSRS